VAIFPLNLVERGLWHLLNSQHKLHRPSSSWMSRPRNWRTVQEISWDQHPSKYLIGSVALEGASVDLHIGTARRSNCSSHLKVVCGAPGIGARRKFRNVLQTSTHSLTDPVAVLLSKVQV
jgi:hypothetical protein